MLFNLFLHYLITFDFEPGKFFVNFIKILTGCDNNDECVTIFLNGSIRNIALTSEN